MRKASRVLGIIGSSLAAVFGVMIILLAALFASVFDSGFFPDYSLHDRLDTADFSVTETAPRGSMAAFDSLFTIYYVMGGVTIAAAIPGVIACVLVKKKNTAAGVLNIVAAVLALPVTVCMVLFILASVFAFRKEKPPAAQFVYVPAPPGAYPAGYPYTPPPGGYPYAPPPGAYPLGAYPPYPPPAATDKTGEEQ